MRGEKSSPKPRKPMLLPILLLIAPLFGGTPHGQENAAQVDVETRHFLALHVPGTPPPAPRRESDTPPVIKEKPLPPV